MTPKQRNALAFLEAAFALGASEVTLGDLHAKRAPEAREPQKVVKARPGPQPSQDPLTNRLMHLTSGERSSD